MHRRLCTFISVLVLTGCSQDNLATGLPMLKGQPVSQAIGYLGQPAETRQIAGETTYSWLNDQSGSFYVPDAASYPVVSQNGGHPAIGFSQPSMPSLNTYDWHCRLDIIAKQGIIVHTAYEGNAGGCQIFSDKLKPLVTEDAGHK